MTETKVTQAVLAALAPGVALSASALAERLRLPLREVNTALAELANERKIARALVSDDGFLVCQWSRHQPRPRARAEAMVLPIAAE